MARIMTLPKTGENLEEVVLTRWLVSVGDRINVGDPILEAETDKATQEFFAAEGGVLMAVLVGEGEKIAVGGDIAVLTDEAEKPEEPEEQFIEADLDALMALGADDGLDALTMPGQEGELGALIKEAAEAKAEDQTAETELDLLRVEAEEAGAKAHMDVLELDALMADAADGGPDGLQAGAIAGAADRAPAGAMAGAVDRAPAEAMAGAVDRAAAEAAGAGAAAAGAGGADARLAGSAPKEKAPASASALMARSSNGRIRISPQARKLAKELGVDPAFIAQQAQGGRVTSAAIRNHAEAANAEPEPATASGPDTAQAEAASPFEPVVAAEAEAAGPFEPALAAEAASPFEPVVAAAAAGSFGSAMAAEAEAAGPFDSALAAEAEAASPFDPAMAAEAAGSFGPVMTAEAEAAGSFGPVMAAEAASPFDPAMAAEATEPFEPVVAAEAAEPFDSALAAEAEAAGSFGPAMADGAAGLFEPAMAAEYAGPESAAGQYGYEQQPGPYEPAERFGNVMPNEYNEAGPYEGQYAPEGQFAPEAPEGFEGQAGPAVSAALAEPAGFTVRLPGTKLTGIRKSIATRLLKSSREKPTSAITISVDAAALISVRGRYKQKGMPLSIDAVLVRTVATALKLHPELNCAFEDDELFTNENVNIGVATDTAIGLFVPVIKDADKKPLAQIGTELAILTRKVMEGDFTPDDITGGTFTITNLGMYGIEEFVPIINPPECAILSAGAITPQFCPDEAGNLVLKKLIKLTLVFDYRIVDGAPAARFLGDIKQFLECPELML